LFRRFAPALQAEIFFGEMIPVLLRNRYQTGLMLTRQMEKDTLKSSPGSIEN
jgi:hypothetical protein